MLSTLITILILAGIAFAYWYIIVLQGNLGFWKLVAKYPDEAYEWFINEGCWVVIDLQSSLTEKPELGEYNGPFKLCVPKLNGRNVIIYGRFDGIEDSEKRFIALYSRTKDA